MDELGIRMQSWTLLASWLRYGVSASRLHPLGHFRLCNRLRSVVGREGLMAMAVVRCLRFLLCRAHKTGSCAGCVLTCFLNVCLWFLLPSFRQSPLATAGMCFRGLVRTGRLGSTQCHADRIASPWTAALYQAAHAW